jgi:plasmid stabilization system protein ParE
MKIGVSNSAYNDLETIIEYYAQEGVPDIGRQFAEDILERIQRLSDHPDMGRVVPEFLLNYIREIIHDPFRIVYLREEKSITVIRVWRSERLLVLPNET